MKPRAITFSRDAAQVKRAGGVPTFKTTYERELCTQRITSIEAIRLLDDTVYTDMNIDQDNWYAIKSTYIYPITIVNIMYISAVEFV